jgi:hypothetical protein
MGRRIFKLAVRVASVAARAWAVISRSLHSQLTAPPKAYQPERHYMRGPGPACRERNILNRVAHRT